MSGNELDDRLAVLVSLERDGELGDDERAELAARADDPELARLRARFDGVDSALRALAGSAASGSADATSDPHTEAGLAALRGRLASEDPAGDAPRVLRPPGGWRVAAPLLAAAAALILYFAVPQDRPQILAPSPEPSPSALPGFADAAPLEIARTPPEAGVVQTPRSAAAEAVARVAPQPVAPEDVELALMLGVADDDGDESDTPPLSIEDFEIVEQLELMEFLASRGGTGARG